jgi:citronellyl-CoA synthetase
MLETTEEKNSNVIDLKEFGKRFQEWMKKYGPVLVEVQKLPPVRNQSWGLLVQENAIQYSDKIAIKFEDTNLTYQEFNEIVNQYANYFISLGLKRGDAAKVLIKNRVEFLFVYTANAKIGVISSLINTDLRRKTLIHCLNLTPGKIIIVGEECYDAFNNVTDELNLTDSLELCFIPDRAEIETPEGFIDLTTVIKDFPKTNPSTTAEILNTDVLAYLFTSGTTGMPKAARLTHQRVISPGFAFANLWGDITSDDIMYIPLPFFHGTAIMTGWSSILINGGTLALARKFSSSRFWDDCRKYNATGFSYVGELCRYLMNVPPQPSDKDNSVRFVIGNGLRPEIWNDFKERFDIPLIGEFYGSSEGNIGFGNFLNFDCTVGYSMGTYAIVEYDINEDKPIRDKENGFMKKVKKGEVGLLLGESLGPSKFAGYTDEKATEAKLFRNVFKEGDEWFNTGDLMRDQGCNHAQFVDRLGDTYRWKGHNVSTTEVEEIFNLFDQVSMCSAYGVKIPNTDGRAGMAAIVSESNISNLDFKKLNTVLNENLAPYAIPIFIRVKKELTTTHSFKFKKVDLKREGFNIDIIKDPLYIKLPDKSKYVPLTKEIYNDINNQKYNF